MIQPAPFGVRVVFADPVVISVRGDLDVLPAADLDAVLVAVVDRGHPRVVLDLGECGFICAAGLRVLTLGARRLEASGGRLTVTSPSMMARRLLALVGRSDLCADVDADDLPAPVAPPGSLRRTQPAPTSALRELAGIPASDGVVDGALRLVVALADATVGGADGVSVSLRRHGALTTVAASDRTISAMDAEQYETGEGPCVDASVKGERFHTESLATEQRWPAFTPRAHALGINAILSSPLVANDRPVGALNIYSRRPEAFGPEAQRMAARFATETSAILSAAAVDVTDGELAARLGEVLANRHTVALAQGVLMERSGGDEHDAYTTLRRYSAQTGQPLRERAEAVVASTRPQARLWSRFEPDGG